MPEGTSAIRIKRVHAVVFGGHIHHVVCALPGYIHARHIQRLTIDLPIHRIGKQFAKLRLIHIACAQRRLIQILSRAGVVVVVGERACIVGHYHSRAGSLARIRITGCTHHMRSCGVRRCI